MTRVKATMLVRAMSAARRGEWVSATSKSDRAALASLYSEGLLERRDRGGKNEYRPSLAFLHSVGKVVVS